MSKLHEAIRKFEKDFSVVWSYPEARNRFYRELETEIGFLGSSWHSRQNGAPIPDIENHLRTKAKNGFTKNKIPQKYDSPFKPRDEEKLNTHKKFMRELIESQLNNSRTAFYSAEAKEKVIDILSTNFVASDHETGIRFHRMYNNAIPSPTSWSFDELIKKAGVDKYINHTATEVTNALHRNELLTTAAKMVEDPKNKFQIEEAVQKLKQVDGYRSKVGRTLFIDEGAIQKEFKHRILSEMAMDYEEMTLQERNSVDSRTSQEIDKHVNSLDSITQQIGAIENIQSRPGSWDL